MLIKRMHKIVQANGYWYKAMLLTVAGIQQFSLGFWRLHMGKQHCISLWGWNICWGKCFLPLIPKLCKITGMGGSVVALLYHMYIRCIYGVIWIVLCHWNKLVAVELLLSQRVHLIGSLYPFNICFKIYTGRTGKMRLWKNIQILCAPTKMCGDLCRSLVRSMLVIIFLDAISAEILPRYMEVVWSLG